MNTEKPCPSCGYCPTCKRKNAQPWPYHTGPIWVVPTPYTTVTPPWYTQQPYYGTVTVTNTATIGATA